MLESESCSVELEEFLRTLEINVITGKNYFFDKLDFDNVFVFSLGKYVEENQILKEIVNYLASARYDAILKLPVWETLFKGYQSEVSDVCVEDIKHYLSKSDSGSYKRQLILLFLGVACLQKFVACNWIGPCHVKENDPGSVNELFRNTFCETSLTGELSMSGDPIYTNVENAHLLLVSKIIFSTLEESDCITKHWWMMRYCIIHQQILPERNVVLHKKIKDLIEKIKTSDWIEQEQNLTLKIQLLIESGLVHLYYHEIVPAKQYFTEVQSIVGLNIELSGAMGKRTQHQQKALAQLFVKLKRNSVLSLEGVVETDTSCFPCDLHLQDDVLLKHVKFLEDDEETVIEDLYPEEQLVVLSHCCLIQRSGASQELLEEELMAYVDCLLSRPKVWCIHMKALTMRCKLEKKKSRRVERAMMQLQALVDAVNKESPPLLIRQYMFYCTLFPPKWMLEKELADILISLGAVKSALEIYQRLQLWEDIVLCYQKLEMNEQAAVLVREQIKLNETPALWCLLGDVMNDPKCYLKAWEISGGKNARSQRSLGFYYYQKKDFKNCIQHFENSLEINYLQPNVWFALGFAASHVENHELAAQAYRHVVTLDSDNFEAWNNLSNSYIKLKQKIRAWRSLQEALKCNYENWRVWENYLLVCVDIGAFEEAIQAYHRLLDIKGKHEDDEILEIIAKAISEDLLDFTEQPSSRLKSKALSLFGRVTSKVTSNANIWRAYALLHSCDPSCFSDKEHTERVLSYLQKAHRCLIQQPQWEKDFLTCKTVVLSAEKLSDVYLTYLNLSDKSSNLQTKSSAKLMLQSIISRTERQLPDFDDAQAGELLPLIENLQTKLEQVVSF